MYRVQTPGMIKEDLTERSLISNLDGLKVNKPAHSANWSEYISTGQARMIYQTNLCNDNFEDRKKKSQPNKS